MSLENGKCEFELEGYCIAGAEWEGFKCNAELPPRKGGISGKCGAPDANEERFEMNVP